MTRDEFMDMVYSELHSDGDNYRANRIIDAADEYADEYAEEQKRWIPVSERLPENPYGCIVTVMDTNPMTCDEFENIYPSFVGWDGENWNNADGYSIPFEVIAWMPLPQPYMAESEE